MISIIVLGYNGRRFLDGCLRSLLDQDLRDEYELIYADNASTDGSADYVAAMYPRVRVKRFALNLGFAEGNNRAAGEAGGRFLVFVNQDVVVDRGCVGALVAALQNDATLGACQANVVNGPVEEMPDDVGVGELTRFGFVKVRRVAPTSAVIRTRFVSGACFAVDRRALQRLSYLFDPTFFMYGEDLDLSLRLAASGYAPGVVANAIAWHLHGEPMVPRRAELLRAYRATRNRIVAYRKNLPPGEFRRFLPRLIAGAPLKVFETNTTRVLQLLLFLAMVPVTFVAALAALGARRVP